MVKHAERALPANIDAEKLVLGSIILDDSTLNGLRSTVTADDFALAKHQRIWAAICDLYDAGQRVDRITLAERLDQRGQLESVDGLSYLVSLDDGLPKMYDLDGYVRIERGAASATGESGAASAHRLERRSQRHRPERRSQRHRRREAQPAPPARAAQPAPPAGAAQPAPPAGAAQPAPPAVIVRRRLAPTAVLLSHGGTRNPVVKRCAAQKSAAATVVTENYRLDDAGRFVEAA